MEGRMHALVWETGGTEKQDFFCSHAFFAKFAGFSRNLNFDKLQKPELRRVTQEVSEGKRQKEKKEKQKNKRKTRSVRMFFLFSALIKDI